ncbi:MAG: YciI family protein [Thermomicrobium sp.]|nr:YciI family protein [Thermomicrobium sp.]
MYEADSEDEARALIQGDPFFEAGVFQDIQLKAWNIVFTPPSP